ncbi:transposase [Arthrobacter sp. UYNi723]
MAIGAEVETALRGKFDSLLPHLDERQRRLAMGAEARVLGHGGIKLVARAAGASPSTVARGVDELEAGDAPSTRVRQPGGGRKPRTVMDPGLTGALLALVEPDERGDPMSPLRWTTKSLRTLARELTGTGHPVSAWTVANLLHEQGFSLQANTKQVEGAAHEDRDAQFRYLNEQSTDHIAAGQPVISVDTKKKELVGLFKNDGAQWRPAGDPVRVNVHDFPDPELGKANPYGVYDVAANDGWVSVGTDHDTAAFAVESIRRWYSQIGQDAYPGAGKLLICADGGGSNGYRLRAWKTQLAALAAQTGLEITVCHLPPGTSKWNKIEHRLFSHISMNWRGRPLTSHQVIIDLIGATTTRSGLKVHAELDDNIYPTGIRISDTEMAALPITRHQWHGEWNYTLKPEASE